ncbi:hypothetical protein MSAN_00109800 [Mycena sanguinolenta]|uniref:Uncharacterized protein n=1 Tax=Mycena sanguinolenta TaxID=230812 RepID=A0A8H6ZDA1_9AGAR|nr:hypothetical protein MSAN_00109800 [Mycena sanguinolenta]
MSLVKPFGSKEVLEYKDQSLQKPITDSFLRKQDGDPLESVVTSLAFNQQITCCPPAVINQFDFQRCMFGHAPKTQMTLVRVVDRHGQSVNIVTSNELLDSGR